MSDDMEQKMQDQIEGGIYNAENTPDRELLPCPFCDCDQIQYHENKSADLYLENTPSVLKFTAVYENTAWCNDSISL